jgi:hypothetical protein
VSAARKRVPSGIILDRIELVVDGGCVANKHGYAEIDLVWLTDNQVTAKITIARAILPAFPIGARVALQLERLPDAPKPVSKKRRSR